MLARVTGGRTDLVLNFKTAKAAPASDRGRGRPRISSGSGFCLPGAPLHLHLGAVKSLFSPHICRTPLISDPLGMLLPLPSLSDDIRALATAIDLPFACEKKFDAVAVLTEPDSIGLPSKRIGVFSLETIRWWAAVLP